MIQHEEREFSRGKGTMEMLNSLVSRLLALRLALPPGVKLLQA